MGNINNILRSINITPSKSKGQNFLNLADATRLIDSSNLNKEIPVLEIGPGLGVMTEVLLRRGFNVSAVEVESKFVEYLRREYLSFGDSFKVIHSDFREVKLAEFGGTQWQVVSNVPYVFSSELLLWLLENRINVSKSSLLLQREFSERIAGVPATKQYGSLSVHVQAFGEVSLGLILEGSVFFPPATVQSRQLHLNFYTDNSPYGEIDEDFMERVVRASFAMRRKKLTSCLEKAGLVDSKAVAEELLVKMNYTASVRAEELSVADFVTLSKVLKSNI